MFNDEREAMSFSEIRVRFAPSPTGYLHVGGARSAYYNYLFAKKMNGKFILRIEDTDQARSTEESLRMMMEDLVWLGIRWDEGPDPVTRKDIGPFAPYRQSQRLEIYKKVADELIQKGKAFYCFLSDDELDELRENAQKNNQHLHSPYADLPLEKALEKIKQGEKAVVRFNTKGLHKDYLLNDLIRGEVRFPSDMVGDFVLLRSDGMPVYNFCCVVDDHLMKISHVLRAEEHLPNTLRQMMIYEGMGWPVPQFGHMSLVLDENRQKLSKRAGATSCHEFKNEGYLPEALKNFIALLGWSHPDGKEVLSEAEMIAGFDVSRLNPAGAIFDAVKLKWMNAQHLRAKPELEIWQLIEPFLKKEKINYPQDTNWQLKSVSIFKSYLETLQDAVEFYRPLADENFALDESAKEVLAWEPTKNVLLTWKELLSANANEVLSEESFLKIQDEVKLKTGAKGKNLFQPIRVAVIGKPHGTELKILVPLMKKTSLIMRAEKALQGIS
jgi:nondiscriminating glutamyl-tRNA synthetase